MKPTATEYAKQLIKDNPKLFNKWTDRELLETTIAFALLEFSVMQDRDYLSKETRDKFIEETDPSSEQDKREEIQDTWEEETLPPIFNDIINSHFNIKTT